MRSIVWPAWVGDGAVSDSDGGCPGAFEDRGDNDFGDLFGCSSGGSEFGCPLRACSLDCELFGRFKSDRLNHAERNAATNRLTRF